MLIAVSLVSSFVVKRALQRKDTKHSNYLRANKNLYSLNRLTDYPSSTFYVYY
jgi:hypothetical protein